MTSFGERRVAGSADVGVGVGGVGGWESVGGGGGVRGWTGGGTSASG